MPVNHRVAGVGNDDCPLGSISILYLIDGLLPKKVAAQLGIVTISKLHIYGVITVGQQVDIKHDDSVASNSAALFDTVCLVKPTAIGDGTRRCYSGWYFIKKISS